MSITTPIITDLTGQQIVEGIARQNLLLARMVPDSSATPHATLAEIHAIVQAGEAANVFKVGDQIMVKYNDGANDYVLPWDIVHFGNAELEDGEVLPAMYIQSHYAMQAVQFDQNEGFYIVPSGGLSAGSYYFTMGNAWGSNVVNGKSYMFTTTESYAKGDIWQLGKATSEVSGLPDSAPSTWRVRTYKASGGVVAGLASTPTEILELSEGTTGTFLGTLSSSTKYGTSGLNNMQRSAYGYNRWSQSAMRQFLNSSADVGGWFTPQNPYDRRPDQLATMRGFMAGFEQEFLNILKPVKVVTALNTVSDTDIGTSETTYDTFFPASLEQEYCVPQLANVEGEYWEYWKQKLGADTPQGSGSANANPRHIRYGYNAQGTAQHCRLRSASRGYATSTWNVSSTGNVTTYNTASNAHRCAPACVIC